MPGSVGTVRPAKTLRRTENVSRLFAMYGAAIGMIGSTLAAQDEHHCLQSVS